MAKPVDILAQQQDLLQRQLELFSYGGFVFAGVGVLLGIASVFAGYLTFRSWQVEVRLQETLKQLNERQDRINDTLIVVADLAVADLPQVTLSQQIPGDLIDEVGVIDDMFDGPLGEELWRTVSKRGRVARLAYARALFRLGTQALNKRALVGANASQISALALLDLAADATLVGHGRRDPLELRRNIALRKVQVLRQAEQFDAALAASRELDDLGRLDKTAQALAPWCRALVHLQHALSGSPKDKRAAYAAAAAELEPQFEELFGWSAAPLGPNERSRLARYRTRARWLHMEPGSIAYYYVKALAGRRAAQRAPEEDRALEAKFARALDVSLLFFEDARRHASEEGGPFINSVYNLCVALLVAAHAVDPSEGLALEEFSSEHPGLAGRAALLAHGRECIALAAAATSEWRRHPEQMFIYSEGAERLDTVEQFSEDIRRVSRALDDPDALRKFF